MNGRLICGWCGGEWGFGHTCVPEDHGWEQVGENDGIKIMRKKKCAIKEVQ